MHTSHSCRPADSPPTGGAHRARHVAPATLLGAVFSLILYRHGSSWWYAPLAVPGVVLAHLAIFSGIVFVARRASRGSESSHEVEGALLRRPRLFDWMVRVSTLGRERKLREWMLTLADLEPGSVVLDVGCGTGTLLLAAAERVGPQGTLHGIEPAPEMAGHARHKADARGVSLEIVEGSADRLPYPAASFDAVFCTLVLHHVPAAKRGPAIREMRRVLRPGGRAVIVDWLRPGSVARGIGSGLGLVSLLHNLRPGAAPSDVLDIEPLMTELGFEGVNRHAFASGALGAVVGRVGPGAGADV